MLVRNLTNQTENLGNIYTRLSTGQRINKASDDAAGLSVMSTTEANIRISNQAIRNLNDGISLGQIADNAIEQLSSITTRIKELAGQSANGAYSNTQRQALDAEAQSLISEYNRIIESTKFNGRNILTEGSSTLLQAGIGIENTLNLSTAIGSGADVTELAGTGAYNASTTAAGLAGLEDFITGDLNGDGYDDLVYIDGPLSVRLSDGAGGFSAATNYASGGSGTSYGALADLDGDGDLDIITSNENSDELGVLLNNGSGSFAAPVSYNNSNGAQEIAVGDFNEDGNLDILSASSLDANFSINFGNGDGTFDPETTGLNQQARSDTVKTADLDGDGHLDLVFGSAAGHADNEINIYFGTGSGTFGSQIRITLSVDPTEIQLADINGDSLADIVYGTPTGITVLANQASRTFSQSDSIALADVSNMDTADYNLDGYSDLLVAGDTSNAAYLYSGNADGTLTLQQTFTNGSNDIDFVKFANVDTDGVADLLFYSQENSLTSAYIGESEIITHSVDILSTIDISTRTGALQAIEDLETVSTHLSTKRGILGAGLSRAETFLQQLTDNTLALSEAKSRISDADIAEESARLIRQQILQQATTALLSQSGSAQRIALELLK